MADAQFVTGQQTAASSTNKVLRSTYMLLSMTLVFSAMMANPELSYADRWRNSGSRHSARTNRNDFLFPLRLRSDNEERFLIYVRLPDDWDVGRDWQHRSVVRGQHDGLGNIRAAPCHFSGDCHSHVRFHSV